MGASLLVARDLEQKLTRVDKECHMREDWHGQLLSVRNIHPDDLAIVFSYSGLTHEMVTLARKARERGAKVVAVTRAMGGQLGQPGWAWHRASRWFAVAPWARACLSYWLLTRCLPCM